MPASQEGAYDITTFECDRSHKEVTKTTWSIGEETRICVGLSQGTIDRGVTIHRFENVAFTKGTTSYQAVEDGAAADGGLTQLECKSGDTICAISTLLPVSMFESTGTVTISGGLSLQYGTVVSGTIVSSPISERYRINHEIHVEGPKGNHPFKGVYEDSQQVASDFISPGGMLPVLESTWKLLRPILDHAGANSGEVARDGAYTNVESEFGSRPNDLP